MKDIFYSPHGVKQGDLKRARVFIYDSKQLTNLEHFSSDGGINVMIINVQAFTAQEFGSDRTSKFNRRY